MLSEGEKGEAREEAKKILEGFGKALEKVKVKEHISEHEGRGYRDEGKGEKSNLIFKKRILSNAPKKDSEGIIAERADWK